MNHLSANAIPALVDAQETGLMPVILQETLLRQKVVASLRRAIELGTLKPGQRLIEKDLCARLGVSRTSLREALRDLEANGVVAKISPRELVITRLMPQDIANLHDIRGAVEALIVDQFIAHADDAAVVALREIMRRLRRGDPATGAYLDAQREYYRVWCTAAGNPHAFDYLTNLQLRLSSVSSEKLLRPDLLARNFDEKQAIVDAMARRDLPGALSALREHVASAKQAALACFTRTDR